MSGESPETKIARMDERLNVILLELQQARDGRKHQYEKLESMGRSIQATENRLESVEKSLAKASPTIDEFITIKHKVQGAGVMGKWVWTAAGFIIGIIMSSKETIIGWLTKS